MTTSTGVTITPEDINRGMGLGMSFSGGGLGTAAKYRAALEAGQITRPEYEAFMQALGQQEPVRGQGTPAFPDKSTARTALNSASRIIDRYWSKHQASSYEGGQPLTPAERQEWQSAFKTKQNAQQYLEATQPLEGFEDK
jgi:hypothetical protein